MADQDYPNLYALMEASVARVRDAALAYEKTLGGSETDTVPVNGYPAQPTIAGRVAAAIDELAATMESAAMAELRSLLREIPVDPGTTSAHEFSDGFGFILAKILIDGTFDLPGFQLKTAPAALEIGDESGFTTTKLGIFESVINGLTIRIDPTKGIYVTDEFGFIIAKADKDGAYWGSQAAPTQVLPPKVAQLDQQQRTDIKQIIEYGQSLSVGHSALPAISLTQPYLNVMLQSGVRLRPGDVDYDKTAFAPLVEAVGPPVSSNQGETPVTGICNGITRRAIEAGEVAENWVMCGAAPGRSGWSVEQLSPAPLGTQLAFEKVIELVKDANDLAVSLGKSYSVWAYSWEQGESNYNDPWARTPYQYMQYQLALFDRMTVDVMGVTGQLFRPYLFTYQVAAHRRYNRDVMPIALTQWRISRQRPDVVVAAPCYMFKTAADNLHLTNESSWLLGEYKARAIFKTMVNRSGKWRPLEPVSVDWQPTYIDVKFHVPHGKLVLDTALCAMTENFGFIIREADAPSTIISSVTVTSFDTVRIALSSPATSDAVLTYARGKPGDLAHSGPTTGARGNLRDTHGDVDKVMSPTGITYDMHNTCVMFEYSRKSGF